ncbi:MAG: nucleoside-triphosphatase [Candidatus Ventricola sp.]
MPSELTGLRRHLFLTGEKQVGKSTLLRRLIEAKQLDCAGFETQAFFLNGERRGFTLHGRVGLPPYQNDCICCARIEEKRSVPVLPVFEENGVLILKRSLASPAPYLLMDELGRLERQAGGFIAQVEACLNSDKRVLGVLQRCDAEHVARIARREDVTVLTVTLENRDALLQMLTASFISE